MLCAPALRIGTRLSIAFSVTAASLNAARVAAILLIDHLSTILADISFHNLQNEYFAHTKTAIRLEPTKKPQHLARLADPDRWARTAEEHTLLKQTREAFRRDRMRTRALSHLESLAAYHRKASRTAHKRVVPIHRRIVTGIIIFMIDGTLLLVLLMVLVRRWLLNPMLALRDAARIAEGTPQPPLIQPPQRAAPTDRVARQNGQQTQNSQ